MSMEGYANIGSRRQLFTDDFLVDTSRTTAEKRLHAPEYLEPAITLDRPWEGDGCTYHNIVWDEEKRLWRMYYIALEMFKPDGGMHGGDAVRVCVLESADGRNWVRPELGIVEFNGSTRNNIILTKDMLPGILNIDNFFVMRDANPAPAVCGRFKAVMAYNERIDGRRVNYLASFVSDDGCHFERLGVVTRSGYFDTLNTIVWHEATGRYLCYIRSFHQKGSFKEYEGREKDGELNLFVRDIRVLTSTDFMTWSEPEHITFDSERDYPLYTNCVTPCPGAEHLLIGMPTRYVERQEWTANFDRLCGREKRLERMKIERRFGLAVTDCLFMSSRDGKNWARFDQAFLRPGPEYPTNWVYGSCYPCVGMIKTPSRIPGGDDLLKLFVYRNHWSGEPTVLESYAIRQEGFVSRHADAEERVLVTKPFIFSGNALEINFSTSAMGYARIVLQAEGGEALESAELFGDSARRRVDFDGDLSALAGKPVRLRIALADADIYSFRFFEANGEG